MKRPWQLAVMALLLAGNALAGPVVRGPYLQRASPDSITIRWRTSVATDSRVRFGSSPDSLTGIRNSRRLTPKTQGVS